MDWDKIVSEYAYHLSSPGPGPMIRDVTQLPYPREIVRAAIMNCLKAEDRRYEPARDALKSGYIALACYQQLTPIERGAVHFMWEKPLAGLFPPVPKEFNEALPVYEAVVERFSRDKQTFAADLRELA